MLIDNLHKIFPDSAALTSFMVKPSQSHVTNSIHVRSLPRMMVSYYNSKYKDYTQEELRKECTRVFSEELKITTEESEYLAECTRLQSQSSVWWEHRQGRLTSSKFFAICRTSTSKPAKSLDQSIMSLQSSPKSAPLM